MVPGWGCWGGFNKTKISKINVYFIKKDENCVSIQGQGTALHPPRVLKNGAIRSCNDDFTLSAFFGVSSVLPETIENNRSISLAFIAYSFNFYFFLSTSCKLQPQTNITRDFTESWKMVRV